MKDFADKYNDLRAAIENEIYSSESSIDNKGALRDILANIKNELFGSGAGSSSIFSFGFSLDEKNGNLLFNQKDFENSTKNGTADLEALFAGTPDKKGIATSIDEVISISGVKKSLIDYEINMISREESLKKDKESAEKTLDSRYATMAQQFASYGVIINQMEASFSGLKMMIQQSIASK
jgi:flagellar hook-associated protein 2